ncbi:MAG: DNA-binding protein, partial [Advenella sp.]
MILKRPSKSGQTFKGNFMKKVSGVVISEFDASEYLTTPEDIVAYLNAAIEEGDDELFLAALGDVAKAQGMAQISE